MKKPPLCGSGLVAESHENVPTTNRQRLLQLPQLRPHLIPIGTQKRPLTSGWQEPDRHYSDQVLTQSPAVGLRLGYPVLAVDFDPKPDNLSQAERTFEHRTGRSSAELPISWTVTSGKPGRRQVLLAVDPDAAPWLKPWSHDGLELRWRGQQSVIDGHHPETGRYSWMPGQAPWECELAAAPQWLLQSLQAGRTPQPAQLGTGELPPRSEADLLRALERVPEFFHDQGRRDEIRDLAFRLAVEWGAEKAHAWLAQHSPTVKDLAGYFNTAPTQISPGSIWPFLNEHYGVDLKRHDLKRSTTPATPPAASQQQDKPPASLNALIDRLPDGWSEKHTARPLSPGHLAEMLPAQNFRYNELDLRAYVETSSGWKRITDDGLDSAYVLLTGKGWKISAEPVVKAILHVARQNTTHPVRDYLQRVKADPSITPYDLDQVAPKLFRASQPLHVAMMRKWLIGAAARALNPGCQMDYCLALKGDQGLLKSTSLKALAGGGWFTSTHADGDKDFLQNIHSCWIYELAELETITGKKQAGALKNLITTATDVFRPPYGRTPERMARQSVFCATVNKDQFLRDDTGHRRYWVVPIKGSAQLDRDAITAARDAIWKAAVLAHEAGELPMLSKELEALSTAQNEQYNEQDAWVGMVQAWMDGKPLHRWDPDRDPSTTQFDPAGAFASAEILYSAGLKRPDAITRADEMRLGEVLKGLGFASRQRRVKGKPARLWVPSQPVPTVTTSTAEVVTPQTPSNAMGREVPSQPSQPQTRSRGLKGEGREGGGAAAVSAYLETRGCDTPPAPAGPAAAQLVCPVTTSLSQPPAGCDTSGTYEVGDLVDLIAPDGNWRNGFRVVDVVEISTGTRYRVQGATDGYNVTGHQLRPSIEAA